MLLAWYVLQIAVPRLKALSDGTVSSNCLPVSHRPSV